MTNYYLGQQVELIEQESGWVCIWQHEVGQIGVGYFPSAAIAWDAAIDLIQRDMAARSLMDIINDWLETRKIQHGEYVSVVDSLMQFVLT